MLEEVTGRPMNRWATVVLIALAAGAAFAAIYPATAQSRAESQRSLRLYVLDCGTLLNRDPGVYGLTKEQVGSPDMSDPCFLVVHPNGTLLWETGIDEVVENRLERFRQDRMIRTLKDQLAEIGYKPAGITYLAISHLHGDHAGNANDYAGSTWIVEKAERDYMFAEGVPSNINPREYAALKSSKTIVKQGDHDVFGDGSVVVLSTPGHTPGHQSLFVNLRKNGPVVLSGDLYHYPAERTLNKFPKTDNLEQTAASRAKIEALLQKTGAQLWIQHDSIAYARLKKSPAYYE